MLHEYVSETAGEKAVFVGKVIAGTLLALALGHIFVLGWMILALIYEPESVQHTWYWDTLLRHLYQL